MLPHQGVHNEHQQHVFYRTNVKYKLITICDPVVSIRSTILNNIAAKINWSLTFVSFFYYY